MAEVKPINVLLSFFSTVRLNKEGKLETVNYKELLIDGLGETHTTNESGFRYIIQRLRNSPKKLDYYVGITTNAVAHEAINTNIDKYNKPHLQYIKERYQEIIGSEYYDYDKTAEEMIRTIPYDENGSKDETVARIQDAINTIKGLRTAEAPLNLYIDLTGGMRDANMMMLIISRLLDYDPNIEVKTVLYSYKKNNNEGIVQEIGLAYFLLDLAAGMNEFVNYGSVKTIDAFFKHFIQEEIKPPIRLLVDALRNFSEKIQVCHYDELIEAVDLLEKRLQEFKAAKDIHNDPTIKVILGQVDQIADKYGEIFNRGDNRCDHDLRIIRWCIDNNYIQQAMTLITERIPIYFFNSSKPVFVYKEKERVERWKIYEKYKEIPPPICENKAKREEWFYYWSICIDTLGSDKGDTKGLESQLVTNFKQWLYDCVKSKSSLDAFRKDTMLALMKLEKRFKCEGLLNIEEITENLVAFKEYSKKLNGNSTLLDLDDSTFIGAFLRKSSQLSTDQKLFAVFREIKESIKPFSDNTKCLVSSAESLQGCKSTLDDIVQKSKDGKLDKAALKSLQTTRKELQDQVNILDKLLKPEKANTPYGINLLELVGVKKKAQDKGEGNYASVEACINEGVYTNGQEVSEERRAYLCELAKLYFEIRSERNAANHSRGGADYKDIVAMLKKLVGNLEEGLNG